MGTLIAVSNIVTFKDKIVRLTFSILLVSGIAAIRAKFKNITVYIKILTLA